MTPKLAELIAYCKANNIKGSYNAIHDPPWWRARITVGMIRYNVPAETREEALERAAAMALDYLRDPPPEPGSAGYAEWWERRKG